MSSQTVFCKAGATSIRRDISLVQNAAAASPGDAKTALAFGDITAYYRNSGALTAITPATNTVNGSWSSGGFVKLSDANAPGGYQFDIPNAAIPAAAGESNIWISATGTATHHIKIIASVQADIVSIAGVAKVATWTGTCRTGADNTNASMALPASTPLTSVFPGGILTVVFGTGIGGIMPVGSVTGMGTANARANAPTGFTIQNGVITDSTSVLEFTPFPGIVPLVAILNGAGYPQVAIAALLERLLFLTGVTSDGSGVFDAA